MDGTLGLLGCTSRAGGVPSGGSILTTSKEDNKNNRNMLVDVSSSYPVVVVDDLELGLGLSIGRILTAKDFPSSSSSSCSSSSSVNILNSSTVGTKRTAIDSVSPRNSTSVVGWPPVSKAHRMPILANQNKSEHEEFCSRPESKNKTNNYLSVKVNMDGTLIGRKVDLNDHDSYETLAQTLENMFYGRSSGCSKLLNETSEFVLTYEDKDGDCMLVGDVPWPMFLSSVKRLRILRNPESSGLASRFQEKNKRRRMD